MSLMRRAGHWLVLLALLLKAFTPAGFMLTPSAQGEFVVVLCSGHGPVQSVLDLGPTASDRAGKAPHQNNDGKNDQPCAFAMAATAALTPDGVAIAAPFALPNQAAQTALRKARPQIAPAGPPLPARGPPRLA